MTGERILVIDDSRLFRNALQRELSDVGYDVATAVDGQDGVETARGCPPDLIVTDLVMPIMSGEDVCRCLKADAATRMIPIIMFTGSEETDMIEELEAGADDYLPKSRHFRELKAKVKALLRIKHLQDQLVIQNQKLVRENERNALELKMARKVQESLLPREGGRKGRLAVAFRYLPTHWVGGDLFDVFVRADGATDFFISDVSGHGVSSAFVTAMIKTSLLVCAEGTRSVAELAGRINDSISPMLGDDMFVTACFGRLDAGGTKVEFLNAGHPPALILRSHAKSIEHLESECCPLGVVDNVEFRSKTIEVQTGDRLILYTDGIIEADGVDSPCQFGIARLEQSVLARWDTSLDELVEKVIQDLIDFSGRRTFDDDVNLVALNVLGL